jgi:hypothetical protein
MLLNILEWWYCHEESLPVIKMPSQRHDHRAREVLSTFNLFTSFNWQLCTSLLHRYFCQVNSIPVTKSRLFLWIGSIHGHTDRIALWFSGYMAKQHDVGLPSMTDIKHGSIRLYRRSLCGLSDYLESGGNQDQGTQTEISVVDLWFA